MLSWTSLIIQSLSSVGQCERQAFIAARKAVITSLGSSESYNDLKSNVKGVTFLLGIALFRSSNH